MPVSAADIATARSCTLAACLTLLSACAPVASVPAAPCEDLTPAAAGPHHLRAATRLMGTAFEIRLVTDRPADGCAAASAAFAEVGRIEALFSEYRDTSEVSAINRGAGQGPVAVDEEVFTLMQRALWAAEATSGAFDPTFAACGRLWSIRDRRIPDTGSLAACLEDVGYRRIRMDPWRSRVDLPAPGMRIGFGGIAKGHGVDRAAAVLRARGLTRFVVDGGGDLLVEGTDVDGAWAVQIAHPRHAGTVHETVRLDRGAIVTSGDYLRYFEQDGVRYHHILDPATGHPARRAVAVTVIAPSATDADALATGLFVLGPERGLALVERLPGVEALYFDPDLRVTRSRGFPRGEAGRPNARATLLP